MTLFSCLPTQFMSKFHLETAQKTDNIILQGSVETRNRCYGQYKHCFVGNLFRCKSAKNYTKHGNVEFFGPPRI